MPKNEVMMPIIAISSKCIECPEIDIGVAQKEVDTPSKDSDLILERHYENTLYCKHYERCRLIRSTVMKGGKYV